MSSSAAAPASLNAASAPVRPFASTAELTVIVEVGLVDPAFLRVVLSVNIGKPTSELAEITCTALKN